MDLPLRARLVAAAIASAALVALAAAPNAPRALVICAPGYPGSTALAQPTMDAFARYAEKAAGWKANGLAVSYFETEAGGIERMTKPDAALALVTLPFFVKNRQAASMKPRLVAVGEGGSAEEVWSLVAKRGAVASPAALDGWEITGLAGFAPEFVRGPVLGAWGELPATARITFTSRVPSSLLKAAAGEKLAVLLDSEQAKALATHPKAAELEIVARSRPLPASLVCTLGAASPGKDVEALLRELPKLHEKKGGIL